MPTTRSEQHPPAAEHIRERWRAFGQWERTYFPSLIGMQLEEVRTDYARMRLVYRPELEQREGVIHGGAIASLLDSVVVPAIGQAYAAGEARFSTVDMHIQFMAAAIGEDLVAEGWIVRRGRRVVFCESEARGATGGKLIARAMLTYNVQLVQS
jgi:uncharacterized protein (TIGR00369 family)